MYLLMFPLGQVLTQGLVALPEFSAMNADFWRLKVVIKLIMAKCVVRYDFSPYFSVELAELLAELSLYLHR